MNTKRMSARSILTAAALSLLLPFSAAQAQFTPIFPDTWGGWEDLGGSTGFGPECISTKPNSIDCFTIAPSGTISRRSWDGSAWRAWETVPGLLPPPNTANNYYYPLRMECVSWGPDHVDCFVRNSNNHLMRRTWDGAYDHGWQNLGGVIASVPDCVSTEPRRLDCFARWNDGRLAHIAFDGDNWGNWVTYPASIKEATKPECVAYIGGRIECIAMWPDQSLRHFSVRNPLQGFKQMTLPAVSTTFWNYLIPRTPVCRTEPGTTRLACFSPWLVFIPPPEERAVESFGMWTYDLQADQWNFTDLPSDFGASQFTETATRAVYDFDCVMRSGGRTDCMELVARETRQFLGGTVRKVLLRQNSMGPNFTSGWMTHNPTSAVHTMPATFGCLSWGGDRLDCFAGGVGFDASPLWHAWLVPATRPIFFKYWP